MKEIIWAGITLAVMAVIGTWLLIAEKRRHSLFPDDGIVWNTAIDRRMHGEQQKPEETA